MVTAALSTINTLSSYLIGYPRDVFTLKDMYLGVATRIAFTAISYNAVKRWQKVLFKEVDQLEATPDVERDLKRIRETYTKSITQKVSRELAGQRHSNEKFEAFKRQSLIANYQDCILLKEEEFRKNSNLGKLKMLYQDCYLTEFFVKELATAIIQEIMFGILLTTISPNLFGKESFGNIYCRQNEASSQAYKVSCLLSMAAIVRKAFSLVLHQNSSLIGVYDVVKAGAIKSVVGYFLPSVSSLSGFVTLAPSIVWSSGSVSDGWVFYDKKKHIISVIEPKVTLPKLNPSKFLSTIQISLKKLFDIVADPITRPTPGQEQRAFEEAIRSELSKSSLAKPIVLTGPNSTHEGVALVTDMVY